jgi:MOSC domain-containing protein YiiM
MTNAGTTTTAWLEGIFVAETAGALMRALRATTVEPIIGIPGDRYATKQGHWSDERWPDQELTLVEAELAEELGIAPGSMRRNLVTRGLDLEQLIGREFRVGGALLLGVRVCKPCKYLDRHTRDGVFRDLNGRGGLRVAVVEGGPIAVGDAIVVLSPD